MPVETCESREATTTITPSSQTSCRESAQRNCGPAPQDLKSGIPGWVMGVAAVLVCVMRLMYS